MFNDYIIIRTSPGERDLCGTKPQNERGGNDKNEKTVSRICELRVKTYYYYYYRKS